MVIDASSRSWSRCIRFVLVANLILILLSCIPWFSGSANHTGFADRLFQPLSGDGFRIDFLYVLLTGLFAFAMLCALAFQRPLNRRMKTDACLCTLAAFGTVAYVIFALFSGLLYFG